MTVMIGACVVFSAWMIRRDVLRDRYAAESVNWPVTRGIITKSASEVRLNSDGSAGDTVAVLIYEYEAGGAKYVGRELSYNDDRLIGDEKKEFSKRFPLNGEVHVHYDPADPARAVLIPGALALTEWQDMAATFSPLIPLGFGAYMASGWVRAERRRRERERGVTIRS